MDNQEKWDDLNTQVDYLILEIDDVNSLREPLDFTGNVRRTGQAGSGRGSMPTGMCAWHHGISLPVSCATV